MEEDPRSRAHKLLTQLIQVDQVINKVQGPLAAINVRKSGSKLPLPNVPDPNPKTWDDEQSRTTSKVQGKKSKSSKMLKSKSGPLPPPITGRQSVSVSASSEDGLSGGFSKPQMSYCPKCYKELPLGSLRHHMAEQCPNNDINCPEHDCSAIFPADHLKIHLATECLATKRRKKLIDQAKQRKAKEEEAIRLAQELAMTYVKPKEIIAKDEFLMDDISTGEGNGDPNSGTRPQSPNSEELKLKEIEIIIGPCELCNKMVDFAHMMDHKISQCSMRLIYCPNHPGGCPKLVPYALIDEHIKKDCMIEKLKNDMIAKAKARCEKVRCIGCGETHEIKHLQKHELNNCINRKVPCRNAHLGCEVMVRHKIRHKHEEVDGKAKIRYTLYLTGEGSYLDLAEDDVRCPWTCEFWLYRLSAREACKQHIRNTIELIPQFYDSFNTEYSWKSQMDILTGKLKDKTLDVIVREEIMSQLADTVEALEDAAVVSTEISTAIGCAIMSTRRAMTEFLGPHAELVRAKADSDAGKKLVNELMCLRRYPPGQTPPLEETRVSSKVSTRPTTTKTRPGTVGQSRPGSPDGRWMEVDEPILPDWEPPTGAFGFSALGVLMQMCPDPNAVSPEDLLKQQKLERKERIKEAKLKQKEVEAEAAALVAKEAKVSEAEVEVEEASVDGKSRGKDQENKDKEDNPNPDAMQDLIATKPIAIESKNEKDVEAINENEKEEEGENGDHEVNGYFPPLIAEIPPAAQLLMCSLKKDDRGQGGVGIVTLQAINTVMPWSDWYDVIELLNKMLRIDLSNLHHLRIAAGILKEDKHVIDEDESLSETQSQVEQLSEEEIAEREQIKQEKKDAEDKKKRKEKEKLRREMKNLKGKKKLQADAEQEKIEALEAGDSVEEEQEEVIKKTPEEIEIQRKKDIRELKRASREKLIPRLIDAAKSAAGRDCIMFSDTPNKRGAYNKICLDMSYPGEYDDFERKKGEKPKYWFDNQGGGQCGIVCADTALGGAERYSFGKSVPREKWVHLAFIATKEPHNRVTFLMDGLLVGQLKDCAFPLPMACLAGSKNLAGFSGCLLDTRIWTKQRSALETRGTMNILIDLDGPQEPKKPTEDLTCKGLVSWWTYEDGPDDEGEKAQDVSEHRAPTILTRSLLTREYDKDHNEVLAMNPTIQEIRKLSLHETHNFNTANPRGQRNRYWSWANADDLPTPFDKPLPPGQDRPLPIPAYSSMGLCLFELKRLRMAQKGRQLQRKINCPLGCDDFILKKDLRFHLSYQCEFRQCSCRHAPLCKEKFPEFRRIEHEENDCQYIIKHQKIVEKAKKNNALKPCSLCSVLVRVRDQETHDRHICPHRIIGCIYDDCDEKFQSHQLKSHLKYDCNSKSIRIKAILVQRARERTHYPRDWGVTIEYPNNQDDDNIVIEQPSTEVSPTNSENPNPKVIIISDNELKAMEENNETDEIQNQSTIEIVEIVEIVETKTTERVQTKKTDMDEALAAFNDLLLNDETEKNEKQHHEEQKQKQKQKSLRA
jgi:hypothetical protein